jgi:hypothetical protein
MTHHDSPTAPAGEQTPGTLQVLNVGTGDTKYTFNKESPQETETARGVVEAMLKAGYMLFVQVPGSDKLRRVLTFDPATDEYIVQGGVPSEPKAKVKAAESAATAVAPTSGG